MTSSPMKAVNLIGSNSLITQMKRLCRSVLRIFMILTTTPTSPER